MIKKKDLLELIERLEKRIDFLENAETKEERFAKQIFLNDYETFIKKACSIIKKGTLATTYLSCGKHITAEYEGEQVCLRKRDYTTLFINPPITSSEYHVDYDGLTIDGEDAKKLFTVAEQLIEAQ